MTALVLAVAVAVQAASGQASTEPRKPLTGQAATEAYYQFILARHYESEGDVEAAIKALQAAARADPAVAEIRAELSSLYARENRAREAITEANAALAIEGGNLEAHRVLGFVYASLARPDEPSSRGDEQAASHARQAISHLEAVVSGSPVQVEPMVSLTLARLYVFTSAYEKAIPLLTGLVQDLPDATDIVALLADAYVGAGQLANATRTLEEAAPGRPALYASLAELYERQKNWKAAADACEKALRAFPRNADLRTRLAYALLSDTDAAGAARARDLLTEALKESPADTRALYMLVAALRATRDLDSAEATARKLIAVDPGGSIGVAALTEVLSDKRDHRAIVALAEPRAAKMTSGPGGSQDRELRPMLTRLGFAYLELGDFDRAIATFERVRKLAPDDAAPEVFLAQAHLAARHFDRAIDIARTARARFPTDLRPARVEAEALRQAGRAGEGAALLVSVVKEHPENLDARLAHAELEMNAGRFAEAERAIREASAAFPGEPILLFQLGAIYERQKRFSDAERMFRDVIAKDPAHALALNYLGYMLADRGEKLDEAVSLIKRALDLDPYNGSYLDSLGWAYFKKHDLQAAEGPLRRAAEQQPRNSTVQDHYGDLLFGLARPADAIAAWQKALDGDREELDAAAVERKIAEAKARARQR